jgi:predicted amidohydrolase
VAGEAGRDDHDDLPQFGDLFCELYDAVDQAIWVNSVEGWAADAAVEVRIEDVRGRVLRGMFPPYEEEWLELPAGTDRERFRYAALVGLDRAFDSVHPNSALRDGALAHLGDLYDTHGRYSSDPDTVEGALLPKWVEPGRRGQRPDRVADCFGRVVRVPRSEWESIDQVTIRHPVFPPWAKLHASELSDGLRVACAPMLDDPSPEAFRWTTYERNAVWFYEFGPTDKAGLIERVSQVLSKLDALDVHIAVLPELAATERVLDAWRTALRSRDRGPSTLRWVFIGTGNLEDTHPAGNCGVLLDADTGAELLRQCKMFPYNMPQKEVEKYELPVEDVGALDEDIKRGTELAIAECGLGRLCVLICEDLGKVPELGRTLQAHGSSHALAPVFAKPTLKDYWEHSAAKQYANSTGTTVVVANSLVIGRIKEADGPLGFSLVHSPAGAVVAEAERGGDVASFVVDHDLAVARWRETAGS